jgi:hypothetical protein
MVAVLPELKQTGPKWKKKKMGRLHLKCDSTRAETRFRLSAKRTSPFKLTGVSVQSTIGSGGVLRSTNTNVQWKHFCTGGAQEPQSANHSLVSTVPTATSEQDNSTAIVGLTSLTSPERKWIQD